MLSASAIGRVVRGEVSPAGPQIDRRAPRAGRTDRKPSLSRLYCLVAGVSVSRSGLDFLRMVWITSQVEETRRRQDDESCRRRGAVPVVSIRAADDRGVDHHQWSPVLAYHGPRHPTHSRRSHGSLSHELAQLAGRLHDDHAASFADRQRHRPRGAPTARDVGRWRPSAIRRSCGTSTAQAYRPLDRPL